MRQPPANGTALMRELCRLFHLPADYGTRQGVACGAVRVTQALRRGRCLHRPANLRLPPRPVLAVGAASSRPLAGDSPAPAVTHRLRRGAHRASGPRSGLWWQLRWLRRLGCLRRGTFHRGKVPKTRRGLRPPVPLGPRGVHRRKRHRAGSCVPPECPVRYPLPLHCFARDSRIATRYVYAAIL